MKVNKAEENNCANLELREVLWEITAMCNKQCKFCGSKSVLNNKHISSQNMSPIINALIEYPPRILTITGGEPGCVEPRYLDEAIKLLSNAGIKVRLITNGLVLERYNIYNNLHLLEVIGLSINDPSDPVPNIDLFKEVTAITNFGTHNIFKFDAIAELISSKKFDTWQIQLTMGNVYQLDAEGIDYLKGKIRDLNKESSKVKINYVLSDNLQDDHMCSAGINSCSITYDGWVCPCLSERSRNPNNSVSRVGSLFKESLKDIWETKFRDIRFGGECNFKPCRECINYPKVKEMTPTISKNVVVTDEPIEYVLEYSPPYKDPYKDPCEVPRITLYGVWGNNVVSYGVTSWRISCDSVSKHSEHFGK